MLLDTCVSGSSDSSKLRAVTVTSLNFVRTPDGAATEGLDSEAYSTVDSTMNPNESAPMARYNVSTAVWKSSMSSSGVWS